MKNLALAQHLRLDTITYNNVIYTNVTLEEFNEQSGGNYESIEEIERDNKPFLKWLTENALLLEDELTQSTYDENVFEYGSEEYLVCTNDEADELWDEDLENYIEECILPELNERYRQYFDNEAWKSNARFDGRGHSLNRYDGNEYEEVVYNNNGEKGRYYIYRQN